ncbi:hypothetical protein [Microbacterium luteum]|uniref:hypothetical protein n=1 Tax=Microbacterium luteum TaxID=2782167 RepID=UPI0018873452|nr:hypothetical protein [Microbacterium luteum]
MVLAMATRKRYSAADRERLVGLVQQARRVEPGLSSNAAVARISEAEGVKRDTLRGWCRAAASPGDGFKPQRAAVERALVATGVIDMPGEAVLISLLRDMADALDTEPTNQLRVAMLSAQKDLRAVAEAARLRAEREKAQASREAPGAAEEPSVAGRSRKPGDPVSLESWRSGQGVAG